MATPPLPLRFVMSGTRVEDLPPTRGEVAIVGRSNVGKSSIINSIANRKGLAKVSKTPGRTQLLNLFELPDGTSVLDLPGYGFANAPASVRATWPEMIEGYLLGRQNLHAVIALIDAEVGPTKNDTQTLAWLRSHGLPVKVIATKHEKVKPSKRDQRRNVVHVLDVYEARQWQLPIIFLCGMTERAFPRYHASHPILTDDDRLTLRSRGITLLTSAERQREKSIHFDPATAFLKRIREYG